MVNMVTREWDTYCFPCIVQYIGIRKPQHYIDFPCFFLHTWLRYGLIHFFFLNKYMSFCYLCALLTVILSGLINIIYCFISFLTVQILISFMQNTLLWYKIASSAIKACFGTTETFFFVEEFPWTGRNYRSKANIGGFSEAAFVAAPKALTLGLTVCRNPASTLWTFQTNFQRVCYSISSHSIPLMRKGYVNPELFQSRLPNLYTSSWGD